MKAILFLDNGEFLSVDFDFYRNVDTSTQYHRDKLEKKIVKRWNQSQPNMVHKVVRVKLMRN